MGWTTMSMNRPVKEWFKEYWESPIEGKQVCELIDSGLVNYTELYGAIKIIETGDVFCATFLVSFSPKSVFNFSYKSMTESVGPYMVNCPKRIFDLLTPLVNDENGWAKEWREKQKRMYEKRSLINKIKDGTLIKTKEPISFGKFGEYSYFRKTKEPKKRNLWQAFFEENTLNETKLKFMGKVKFNLINFDFDVVV
jgi:hypothetical protein